MHNEVFMQQNVNLEVILKYNIQCLSAFFFFTYFFVFEKETLAALVAVAEIEEKMGKKKDAFKTFERALVSVKKLHHNHPLIALLNLKLYFLHRGLDASSEESPLNYLTRSFQLYEDRFGRDKTFLLAPLMAIKNNEAAFISQILQKVNEFPSKPLLSISEDLWPKELKVAVNSSESKFSLLPLCSI